MSNSKGNIVRTREVGNAMQTSLQGMANKARREKFQLGLICDQAFELAQIVRDSIFRPCGGLISRHQVAGEALHLAIFERVDDSPILHGVIVIAGDILQSKNLSLAIIRIEAR